MLLSIIVPVYNVHEYIRRCIDSLLKTDPEMEYEILLVNDGSTDDSGNICDEYASRYDYIKVIHKSNGGLSDARNHGLQHAVGMYVMFVDSDDYVEENSIHSLYHEIAGGQCDIYCSNYYSLTGSVRKDLQYTPTDEVVCGQAFLKYQLEHGTMISTVVQNVYRREYLLKNQLLFKKGIYHEDEEWYPRVFLSADSVACVKTGYYVYCIRENSIMQQKNLTKHIRDFIATMTDLMNRYESEIDGSLFCLLKDDWVSKYLAIYARGNFGSGTKDVVLPVKMLRKGLVRRGTKIKVLIFAISRRLYCKLSRMKNARR